MKPIYKTPPAMRKGQLANRPGKAPKKFNGLGAPDKFKNLKPSPTLPKEAKKLGSAALKAARATRIGKIAAGVAGAALLAKAGLEKLYEKRTGKKPFTKREKKRTLVDKKMGGGMMKKPMGYDEGGLQAKVDRDATIRKARASIDKIKSKEPKRNMLAGMSDKSLLYAIANAYKDKDRLTKRDLQAVMSTNTGFKSAIKKLQSREGDIKGSLKPYVKKKMGGGLTEATRRLRAQGLRTGGMCRGMGAALRGGDFKGVK